MAGRILVIVPDWFTFSHHMRGQPSALRAAGFEVEIAGEPDARAVAAAAREGVAYHALRLARSASPLRDARALGELARLIARGRYDIVSTCNNKSGLLGAIAGRRAGVRGIVYVLRGLNVASTGAMKRTLKFQLERAISMASHRVVVISRSMRGFIVERRLCPPGKAVVLGEGSLNGVDTEHYRRTEASRREGFALRERLGITPGAFVLGFVGRLAVEKGIAELGGAWARLRDGYPRLRILIAAPPEVERPIAGVVERLRADPRVHFAGFLPDPRPAYAAMDCLVLPSYGEGFGNVLLEAGAMERPVLATRVMGCTDAVVHDRTGLLVEPHDARSLAEGIERVIASPALARVWGENGRRRCEESFRRELVWARLAGFYERLVRPAVAAAAVK